MVNWIALFRGINVGGKNVLPMAALRQTLEAAGLQGVRTCIQSGNVVFSSPRGTRKSLARRIREHVLAAHGLKTEVLLIDQSDFLESIQSNPFPHATGHPKTLHFFFLFEPPQDPKWDRMVELKTDSEEYELVGSVFYLLAPEGMARSKLAGKVEKLLGVKATARNFRTVDKLRTMLDC